MVYYNIIIIIIGLCCVFLCSRFLGNMKEAFDKNPSLTNLLLDDFFKSAILRCQVRTYNVLWGPGEALVAENLRGRKFSRFFFTFRLCRRVSELIQYVCVTQFIRSHKYVWNIVRRLKL